MDLKETDCMGTVIYLAQCIGFSGHTNDTSGSMKGW
jgi:hypothetical protein